MRLAPFLAFTLAACDVDCPEGFLEDADGNCLQVDDSEEPAPSDRPPRGHNDGPSPAPDPTTTTTTTITTTTTTTTTPEEPACTQPVTTGAWLEGDDGGFDRFGTLVLMVENWSHSDALQVYVTPCGEVWGSDRLQSGPLSACTTAGGMFYPGCLDVWVDGETRNWEFRDFEFGYGAGVLQLGD